MLSVATALILSLIFGEISYAIPPLTVEQCEKYLTVGTVPKAVNLVFAPQQIETLFLGTVKDFREKFNVVELVEVTSRLVNGGEFDSNDLRRLIANRAPLRQLRFAFGLFSQTHKYPPFLNDVTKLMGDIQDAYRNAKPAMLRTKAVALLAKLDLGFWQKINAEIQEFRPCSTESFMMYIRDQIYFLENELNSGRLTAAQFHEMRKVIGRLVALYGMIHAQGPEAEVEQGLYFLSALNLRMGLVHDNLIAESLALSRDYHRDRVVLDTQLREVLNGLIRDFSNL